MPTVKFPTILLVLCLIMANGCSSTSVKGVPADFNFVLDARSAGEQSAQNVNIRINAQGEGRYERYNTDGVIRQDENDRVIYEKNQIVESGEFNLTDDELAQLWQAINENNYFELTGDYRMAIGLSYAFIMIEADGRRHQVFNIGMEVPEIRAIVEAAEAVMPREVDLDYGEGYAP